MEPSRDLAPAGEFNGSESGWTTYIDSPSYNEIHNDDERRVETEEYGNNYKNAHGNADDDDNDDKGEDNNDNDNIDTDDEESADSMTSDASSGPSHVQLLRINSERSHGFDYLEHTENDHEKIISAKRASKQGRKSRYERTVEKEEDSLSVADSASSHVYGGAR